VGRAKKSNMGVTCFGLRNTSVRFAGPVVIQLMPLRGCNQDSTGRASAHKCRDGDHSPQPRRVLWSSSEMFSQRTNWKLTPNKYMRTLEEMRSSGTTPIDLTVSNPTECGLKYDSAAILQALQDPRALVYEPEAKGLLAARQAVARYYGEDHGISIEPDAVLLTTSTSEAYSYVFRLLCNAHDEILVPKPSYPLLDFLGDLQDVTLIPYMLHHADGWFIDFDSLVRALTPRTRAIVLVHPNNPTGSYVKCGEMQRLNELCRERSLALIVDEVFLDYSLDGQGRRSFAANREALTFTLSGLSKVAALPQMKVAWVTTTGPGALVRTALERLEIIADTYLSLNSPTQWGLPTLLEQRRSVQPQILERIRGNWAQLRNVAKCSGLFEALATEGGWYAVLRVTKDCSDEDLAIEMMQKAHVLVHPGHFYDFASDGQLVISLIAPDESFRTGVERMAELLG
jgi:alanine-synthesizing transaminase